MIYTLDCTLRDGGYYNNGNFSIDLVNKYLKSMSDLNMDFVEIGFRSLQNNNFKGPYAYSSEIFLDSINLPENLKLGVMVNASEIIRDEKLSYESLTKLFVRNSSESKVKLVRIACHYHEFNEATKSIKFLKDKGYVVGLNLMQIAQCSDKEIESVGKISSETNLDVLYFADSLGGMDPKKVEKIISLLKLNWKGPVGIHTHDNMGLALQNTLKAKKLGATWLDSTVMGMGRGPGNAKTEELMINLPEKINGLANIISLIDLIDKYFKPLKQKYDWGKNIFYFLSGKYNIHPTYIQKMINDSRYDTNDILAVIEKLKDVGSRKFNVSFLNNMLNFYESKAKGSWKPTSILEGKELLLLATGPGVNDHSSAIESYITKNNPVVIAFNTQSSIDPKYIDYRIASHPVRLMADCKEHLKFNQPLITPFSMLPEQVKEVLIEKDILDYGLQTVESKYLFEDKYCIIPKPLVMSYALALAVSGKASRILLAGFDGYKGDDPRNQESNDIFKFFIKNKSTPNIISITPTRYDVVTKSVYGLDYEK